ncbi:MAG: nucleoside-diphosphate-sugar epimerase [Ignavibacteria bacterium]|nr:MAG: nucleoside-diphosphate-sugar epimerase [Ignavibacteria bacterium]KAF0156698.1 MAG: nucleoside-diphosphate-sugar epimerase [Ignavibacteria bacterium]
MKNKMRVLFIGGTGVISSECSKLCVDKGMDLVLLNRGKSFRKPPSKAEIINADIRNYNSTRNALTNQKFDVVVDWIAYNEEHVKNDYEFFKYKTGQYIFISTASVYQKPVLKLPITEETPLDNPFWLYSRAKIACEKFLLKVYKENDFPFTIVRPSHTYDETKNPLKENYLPFHRMKHGKPIIIHDDGNATWTLTHAKDFAKGFVGLLGNSSTIGEAYHITTDETLTWNEIAELIAHSAGYELKAAHIPSSFIKKYDDEWGDGLLGDKAHNVKFDNSKIRKIVPEFNPAIKFEQGASEIADFYVRRKIDNHFNEKLDLLMDKIISDYFIKGKA